MKRRRVAGRFVKDAVEEEREPEKKKPAAVGAPRPRGCRTFVRNRMAEAMPEIVEALVEKAKGGSVAHAKALAELSGLTKNEKVEPKRRRRGKTFVGALLEEMGEA